MKKYVYFILLFILLITSVEGATIYGSIYDLTINKINNVVVEIDSTPNQRFVAVNGTYQFEVSNGNFKITTFYHNKDGSLFADENITIIDDGIYVLDLFLYPTFEEDEIFGDINFEINDIYNNTDKSNGTFIFGVILVIVLIVVSLIFLKIKKKTIRQDVNEEIEIVDSDINAVIDLLKKNNGRLMQKEIRKSFPLSEAKISLMITELESMNKIKKIKRGRSNIIILKK